MTLSQNSDMGLTVVVPCGVTTATPTYEFDLQ